ncbi:MAG TPA: arginine--tRNA ligase [bacterium]|nr:arginine--tRNA ligase [bacterium]HPT29393.1 arginine--tRNA ligase [bacterium]
MSFWLDLKEQIKNEVGELEISYPPNPKLGHLSLAVFALAKKQKKNPNELAQKIAETIKNNAKLKTLIAEVTLAGPYINLQLNQAALTDSLLKEIKIDKDKYGRDEKLDPKTVMIEFSNVNTHKEYHVGHLRNLLYGRSLNNILAASGENTIPVSYINDFGIHVAKTLWGYLKFHQDKKLTGYTLGKIYAESAQKLESQPEYKEEVAEIMKGIESRQGEAYNLWQKTRELSLNYFQAIYNDLGVKFTNTFFESAVIAAGLELVEELKNKKILIKSDGAIIANLEKYNLGVLPIIRSDGTALYPVADLALAKWKFDHYNLFESIYVVDSRQSLYFKQLFKILELSGYEAKMTHLPYEFVTLPSGMMSSRSGNVITYDELLDIAQEKATLETKSRHQNWSAKKIAKTARAIALSIIKFELIKVSANKTIVFDINEALRFDGYTATYLQYTQARANKLIKKAPGRIFPVRNLGQKLTLDKEIELITALAKYPETIQKAALEYDPSIIAHYLFELSQKINDYYQSVPVLKAESKLRKARIELFKASRQTLINGLELLGIKTIKEI